MRLKLKFTALQGLHTGSDNQNTGNFKMQLRKPYVIKRQKIESNFTDEESRRRAATEIAHSLWESIPSDLRYDRAKTINEEFFSALSFASFASSKAAFLQKFGAKFGIRGMTFTDAAIEALDAFGDIEFLEVMRNETQIIQIMLKSKRVWAKDKKKGEGASLFDARHDIKPEEQAANEAGGVFSLIEHEEEGVEFIPVLSANQFRHAMRDAAMDFFFGAINKKNFTQTGYYQYFSGGALAGSTGKINVKQHLDTIKFCPPLALFGTAKGDRMITGMVMISDLVPRCKELGTGQISHYQLINPVFGTRKDGAKDERRYEIELEATKDNPQQMLYYTESLVPGTVLDATIRLRKLVDDQDFQIAASCLLHTVELLKETQNVGAKAAVAHGQALIEELENTFDVSPEIYVQWLTENRDKIMEVMENE